MSGFSEENVKLWNLLTKKLNSLICAHSNSNDIYNVSNTKSAIIKLWYDIKNLDKIYAH